MHKRMLTGLALAMTLGVSTASAAVLVVRSSGPSARAYPAGKAVAESQSIVLRANDVVILLDSRGTRTLRGPGTFSAGAASAGATSAMAALTGQTSARRSRVGAVRGAPTGATAGRNVWQADLGRSGNICVVNPADAGLYRAKADTAGKVVIREIGTNRAVTIDFAAGQRNASWPVEMPIVPGRRYELRGTSGASTLSAVSITPVPAGMEGLAQSLIRNNCEAQLDVLIDTFTAPSAS